MPTLIETLHSIAADNGKALDLPDSLRASLSDIDPSNAQIDLSSQTITVSLAVPFVKDGPEADEKPKAKKKA